MARVVGSLMTNDQRSYNTYLLERLCKRQYIAAKQSVWKHIHVI